MTSISAMHDTPNPAAQRQIARKTRAGPAVPGFAGPGHTASEVFGSRDLRRTDPFVMLMDDRLDFRPGQAVGEPHPHAGLETVTLMLQGSLNDAAEGLLEEGDLAWMTAGRGVIHNEDVTATGPARILQLWVALPRGLRGIQPDFELVRRTSLPIRREPGVEARLYSGRTGDLVSLTRNRIPVTIVDFHLQPGSGVTQALPGAYSGLLFVVEGALSVGGVQLAAGDVGWIDPVDHGETQLELHAGSDGARVILYAGLPLSEPLIQHRPSVAGSDDEISSRFREYRAGMFTRMSRLAPANQPLDPLSKR